MSNLENAIQLIRQGQKAAAQPILQAIIKSDPKDVQAWFWYIETCSTNEQRIQVLETCLKMNPGNQQVMNALNRLRGQVSAAPPKPDIQSPQSQPVSQPSYYSYDFEEKPQSNLYEEENAYSSSPYSAYTDTPISEPVKPSVSEKKPWEMDSSEYVDNSMLSKPKKPVRSYSTLDVWATALTVQDVKAYEDTLNDPEATLGRAFTWIAISGLVNALLLPLVLILNPGISELASMPEFQSSASSINMTSFLIIFSLVMLILAPIGSVINLAIVGGIQSFLATFFAGTGNYTRTIYAIAAFSAPLTILISLVTLIPIVGQCITFPISIYAIMLNVRALKAAHFISTGAAIGVILSPLILFFIFGCLLVLLASGGSLSQ